MKRVEVVLASAGAGKTFTLTLRFAGLLVQGVPVQDVLAATFTRKAAGEIQARILERLAGAAEGSSDLKDLQDHLRRPDLTAEQCQAVLQSTLEALPRMQVMTLDSWFARLARGFAPELGLDPAWRILEEVEDDELQVQALESVLERGEMDERIALLRDLQRGQSGARVLDRLRSSVGRARARSRWSEPDAWDHIDVPPELEDKAIEELIAGIEACEVARTKKGAEDSRWVKAKAKLVDCLIARDWKGIGSSGLFPGWIEKGSYVSHAFEDVDPRWEGLLQQLKGQLSAIHLKEVQGQNLALARLLGEFRTAHHQVQSEERGLRFDDLTSILAAAARGGAAFDLPYRLDTKLHHLLLDEYQDTNALQHTVLDRNLQELAGFGEEGRTLFVVGDAKQSIYGFREAEPRLLRGLPERVGAEQTTLAVNWRSSPQVLEFVNQLFSRIDEPAFLQQAELTPALNAARSFRSLWEPHQASPPNQGLPGQVSVWEAPQEATQYSVDELLAFTVERVRARIEEAPHASVAVLVRTGDFGVKLLARLAEAEIPAAGEGGRPLVDSPLVRALLGLLRLADHPADGPSLALVLASPLRALFEDLHDELTEEDLPAAGRQVSHRVRLHIVEEGLGPWLHRLRDRLERLDPYDAERLEHLIAIAEAWPEPARGRLAPLVAHLQKVKVEGASDAKVRVLTIHASKGLEYDAVILPQLLRPLYETPSLVSRRLDPYGPVDSLSTYQAQAIRRLDAGLSELHDFDAQALVTDSLCMLYVATTRAKRSLDLVLPHWRPKRKKGSIEHPTSVNWAHFVRYLFLDLEDDPTSNLLWSTRSTDAAWHGGLEETGEVHASEEVTTLSLRPGGELRALPTSSPSATEGGRLRSVQDLLAPPPRQAFEFGSLVHEVLEEVEWLEGDLDLVSLITTVGQRRGASVESVKRAADLLRAALDQEQVRACLERPCPSTEAWRERRFSIVLDGQLWSGTFDRVHVRRNGAGQPESAEILDWKTDAITEEGLAERVEHYRPQLEAYRRVLAGLLGIPGESITASLVFLAAGQRVSI